MRGLIIAVMLMASGSAFADVWQSNKHWDNSWQSKYSNWIATEVGPKFFKDLGSPYRELKIDCADAHYALLAYFSKKNGLHMIINNGRTGNTTDRFDHISNADQRLVAFIRYLAGSYGTESLSHRDTVPVGLRDLKPGDLFMYKIGTNGNYTRHTYILKNINIDGTFDVLYSTQARRDAGKPLNRNTSFMFKKPPFNTGGDQNYWGFRRAKKSSSAHIHQTSLSESDFDQYELANSLLRKHGYSQAKLQFFREVRRLNKTINESPNRVAERNFKNVCHSVQERVEAVQSGVNHNNKLGGRCMKFADYDVYSTPSRDSGIKDDYLNYYADVNSVSSQINRSNTALYYGIFKKGLPTKSEARSITQACAVNTEIGSVDLGSFYKGLFAGEVSFHPNDNIYRRWGQKRGNKTRCEEFYGYPTQ